METGNRLTAARGKRARRECWKEGKVISQRTCMNDPGTWTMVWAQTGCEGQGGKRGAKGGNGTTIRE